MLLPITLPRAMPGLPFTAAVIDVASSGSDVPAATIVKPIMASLTPSPDAIPDAPLTNWSPPIISPARPIATHNIDFHNGISLVLDLSISCDSAGVADFADENVCRRNMVKNSSRTIPSTRLNMRLDAPSRSGALPIARSTKADRSTSGMSLVIMLRSIFIGANIAVMPIMARTLKMLLPTTLPIASSALPLMADTMLMTSSGADVPKATTVNPMTSSDTPHRFAMLEAPSVNMLAPTNMNANPAIRNTMLSIIFSC